MKVLIIGMNPSAVQPGSTVTGRKNSTFDRLYRWMDKLQIERFSFTNCFHEAGDTKKLSADERSFLLTCAQGYDIVLSLGGFAHQNLKKLNIESFKLPHPSPRNRALNSSEFEARELDRCNTYIMEKMHDKESLNYR